MKLTRLQKFVLLSFLNRAKQELPRLSQSEANIKRDAEINRRVIELFPPNVPGIATLADVDVILSGIYEVAEAVLDAEPVPEDATLVHETTISVEQVNELKEILTSGDEDEIDPRLLEPDDPKIH
jgi:hypothetical protein